MENRLQLTIRRRRVHQNAQLIAGNAADGRIVGRQPWDAGSLSKVAENVMGSGVGTGEGVIRRQNSPGIGADETYGPRVAGDRVAKDVLDRKREVLGDSGVVAKENHSPANCSPRPGSPRCPN